MGPAAVPTTSGNKTATNRFFCLAFSHEHVNDDKMTSHERNSFADEREKTARNSFERKK
jgi:hypothetical protein